MCWDAQVHQPLLWTAHVGASSSTRARVFFAATLGPQTVVGRMVPGQSSDGSVLMDVAWIVISL